MVHISPYEATEGLFRGVAKVVKPGGKLIMYGPMKVGGKCTTQSNEDFDATLKKRNASWGIRDFEDLDNKAKEGGFELVTKEDMPANNYLCVWKKVK